MKILHTADWHLGKKLDHFSRLQEQKQVLEELIEIVETQDIDIVVIAGDLFDNFNPNTEAIELFYKTVKQLANDGKRPVIAIAGNHDAPNLIDAPNPLAKECGIILIGHPNTKIPLLKLPYFEISKSDYGFIEIKHHKYAYPIRIIHTPYANEIRLKQYFGENKEDGLNETLAQNWQQLANTYCDTNGVNLLTAHLYINKRGEIIEEPDGEKPIKVGNADMIYADSIPNQMQYTALGHLHGYRNIGSEEKPIVYSSSILPYSFSEAGQTKYAVVIDLEPNHTPVLNKIPLQSGRTLYRKTFHSVEESLEWLNNNQNCLVEITLKLTSYLRAEDRKAIYQSHDGIIHLIPSMKAQATDAKPLKSIDLNKNMINLFEEYFKSKHQNLELNDDLKQLFKEISNAEEK